MRPATSGKVDAELQGAPACVGDKELKSEVKSQEGHGMSQ